MPIDPRIAETLRQHLVTASSSFSIGALGAIAEFHRDAEEALILCEPESLTIATERGALAIELADDVLPVAFEAVGRKPGRWSQEVVFCRPERQAVSHRRTVLSEIGPDRGAVRPQDREAVLFDLGLGAANIDFCVRTDDGALLDELRHAAGRSVLEPGNPVMKAIVGASPHRIALSALGRLEVYQAIPTAKTPTGPHTHVLPDLLAGGMTHPAGAPVPEGYLPALNLYPAHPAVDGLGRDQPFEPDNLKRFAALLELWGDAVYRAEKHRALKAIRAGQNPDKFDPPVSVIGCDAVKIAIRQRRLSSGNSERLQEWSARFDAGVPQRRTEPG